jgi:Camelysin metallo-endopeptidase
VTTSENPRRGRHRGTRGNERTKGIVTVASALAIGVIASGATWSAFNANTSNAGNSFNTGTVSIVDNASGTAMFTVTNMRPGTPVSRCIKVTYTGSLSSAVKMYGSNNAGGLEPYLSLNVTRGTSTGTYGDCTGFTADSTNFSGLGSGVLYSGAMTSFPSTLGTAVADPNSTWTQNEAHWYKFTVDVADDNNAENKNTTATFVWDAR